MPPAVSHGRVSFRANFCFTRVGGSQHSRRERSGRPSGPGLGRGVRQSYGLQLACLGQPGDWFRAGRRHYDGAPARPGGEGFDIVVPA
jgi:hypothetical protein